MSRGELFINPVGAVIKLMHLLLLYIYRALILNLDCGLGMRLGSAYLADLIRHLLCLCSVRLSLCCCYLVTGVGEMWPVKSHPLRGSGGILPREILII